MFMRYLILSRLSNHICYKYIYSRYVQTLVKESEFLLLPPFSNQNNPIFIYDQLPNYICDYTGNVPCLALSEKHLKSLHINDILIGSTYFLQKNQDFTNTKILSDIVNSVHLNQILVKNVHNNKLLHLDLLYKQQNTYKLSELSSIYLKLSKARLTGMVVMTQMCGYYLAPGVFDASTFLASALGTCLTSCSANTINQLIEIPYDSQMNRTKNRILVTGKITPLHAALFATTTGVVGIMTLLYLVNPLTAILGASNLALYTLVYTRFKRVGIINTWLGAIVGALPPIMGWTANCGQVGIGALLLGGLLYTWQFPHFNALSWNLKNEYSRAGYRMMSAADPSLCLITALRHSLYSLPIVVGLFALPHCRDWPLFDGSLSRALYDQLIGLPRHLVDQLISPTFALDLVTYLPTLSLGAAGLALSAYNVHLCYQFYKRADSRSSRKLFRFSLVNLPLIMALVLLHATVVAKDPSASLRHKNDDDVT